MSDNKKPATHMEALTAEMLGDIGKLHDLVAALKLALPSILNGIHKDIKDIPTELSQSLISTTKQISNVGIALQNQITNLPSAADKEMKRAGEEAIKSLATEVGKIAQTIAGDAASVARLDAMSRAMKWASCGVLACAVVFGGTGYAIHALADNVNLKLARRQAVEANAREDAAVAAAEKKAHDEIEEMRKSSGWLGTADGRLAKKFFDLGYGANAAKCDSPVWEIRNTVEGKFCVPNRRNLMGGNDEKYGWKIP